MTWHKARAQPSQGVAGRPHHLGRPAMCRRIYKNRFVYVSNRGGAQVPNAQRLCKEETWLSDQDAWLPGLTSGPHTPNLQPQHCLTPPINTMVLPLAETMKKVMFSPL
jgi:hypothetical protein